MPADNYVLSEDEKRARIHDGIIEGHEYTIFSKGNWYISRCDYDNKIDFQGPNAGVVIQATIDRLFEIGGGKIVITPGNYPGSVTMKAGVVLVPIRVSGLSITQANNSMIIKHIGTLLLESTSVPAPSAGLRGAIGIIEAGSGTADVLYACLKSTADTYSWTSIATG